MQIDALYTSNRSFATTDFTGAAGIYLLSEHYDRVQELVNRRALSAENAARFIRPDYLDLDLLITDVGYTYADHHKLEPHLGDIFSLHFFGRAPIQLNVRAKLLETQGNSARAGLTWLYQHLLRISRVAVTGIVPIIQFVGCHAHGAFLDLSINESSAAEDVRDVSFTFLVFNLYHLNLENTSGVLSSEILFSPPRRPAAAQLSESLIEDRSPAATLSNSAITA